MEPFIAAYKDALQNYAKFDGRLGLGGYWRFFAVNVVIAVVLAILANTAGLFLILYVLYILATLIPGVAAGMRRLHDTGKSGWYLLIGLIPIVGVILLIVWLAQQGEPGTNAYGDPSPDATPQSDQKDELPPSSQLRFDGGRLHTGVNMDFSKFKTNDWLIIGGGAGVLIFTFLKWWKVDTGFGSFGTTGFDHFFTGIVPWLLIVATAALTFLSASGIFKLPGTLPTPLIFLGATALGTFLILMNLLTSPGIPSGVDRGVGLFISLIGAIVATVGAVLGFQASGGDLKDLTDMDKMKTAFGGDSGGASDDMPPPPPPPPPTA